MPPATNPVDRLLAAVRRRLNRHRLCNAAIWTAGGAAGAIVAFGLWYAPRGYAIPRLAIVGTVAAAAIIGLAIWASRRLTAEGAAHFADRFFRLQDAITSYLHFSRTGRTDGYYALQAEQTRRRAAPLREDAIKYQPPRRALLLAACLVAIAAALGLRGPSEKVLREQQLAAETAEATASINDELAELVEKLREETPDPDEKELLDPNQLRKWVDELRKTPDHKEALRQYAQLERKLNEARLALQNKRDEQLLERAAREMKSSQEAESLAAALEQKNYDGAAQQMEKMQPAQTNQPLSKQRQDLARLKAAAQHMAAAARAARADATNAQSAAAANSSAAKASSASAQSSGKSGGASGAEGSGGEMAETMEDLDQSVADLDDALGDAQRQEEQYGQCDAKQRSQCQSCSQSVSNNLAKLSKQLKKLGMCQRAEQRLCKLCQACSQCQSGLCALCQGVTPGGKNAGSGTTTARRDQRDELVDNGQTTQLKGIKGRGSSLSTIESADSGSGVSSRRATARQRTFRRQFESFVAREDVPEEVKHGVKQYFEVIHQGEGQQTREETPHDGDDGI